MENTKDEDIELLCNYRRDRLSTVEEQSQDLNFRVIEYFARNLLAQRVEAAEIAAGRTALAKLICRHIDIEKFVKDGTILPTRISVRNNEQLRRTFPQTLARPRSGMNFRPTPHTGSSNPQGQVPLHHALQSQQPYHAAETCTYTAKRRRVSGNERLQTAQVFPIPILESNGSTTQTEGQHYLRSIPSHSKHQHEHLPPFEEANNTEHGRVGSIPQVVSHENFIPNSEEVDEIQEMNVTSLGLYRDEPAVDQQLSVTHSAPRRSIIDNADTQQPSLVYENSPLLAHSNVDADFTSYAIDFVHTLDDDARFAFGLHNSL